MNGQKRGFVLGPTLSAPIFMFCMTNLYCYEKKTIIYLIPTLPYIFSKCATYFEKKYMCLF